MDERTVWTVERRNRQVHVRMNRDDTAIEVLGNGDRIVRQESEVYLEFAGKRSVICTSPLGGGIRNDLTTVFNHCDLDPVTRYCEMLGNTYEEHLAAVAKMAGLDLTYSAGLSTACFMYTMRTEQIIENGIEITLLLTGGINKNGRCAGDTATLWEENGIFTVLSEENPTNQTELPEPGTINIILHIDANLTPGALAGAIMVITEAKNAAIHSLKVKSCYSNEIATGSGTDGIIVVANTESKRTLTQIRTDTRIGEVIANLIRRNLVDSILESMSEEWNH